MKKSYCLSLLAGFLFIVNLASAGSWPQTQKLLASDGTASDGFGSVAVSGDWAVVGASYDSDMGTGSGSAYIFYRDGTTWVQQAKLIAADGAAGDKFGQSVSISGDYVIVSASYKNSSAGAAYIFHRDGTSWSQQAKLVASDGAASDYFGCSVSISGDYAIVGAFWDDDMESGCGSAYIFHRDGSSWSQQAKLVASDGVTEDRFGCSVAIDGDYGIVGSYMDDDMGSLSGSAYIFYRDGITWTQQTKLVAADGAAGDKFGQSVSIHGDCVISGAVSNDNTESSCGAAYVFYRSGTAWAQQAKLIASDGAFEDYFGFSVSICDDWAIVGASGDDDQGKYSGSAYIFRHQGTTWTQQTKLLTSDGAAYDYFGQSVAICDGWAMAGAMYDDDNGSGSGSAYIFEYCPADMNEDLAVNVADLTIFAGYLYGSDSVGDLDGDSAVNLADFAVIARWWLYGAE